MDRETLIDAAEQAMADRHDMDVPWRTYATVAVDAVLAVQREGAGDLVERLERDAKHTIIGTIVNPADIQEAGDTIAALQARVAELTDALTQAEACMSIVEPRSDKAEYLRILGVVRAALQGGDDA